MAMVVKNLWPPSIGGGRGVADLGLLLPLYRPLHLRRRRRSLAVFSRQGHLGRKPETRSPQVLIPRRRCPPRREEKTIMPTPELDPDPGRRAGGPSPKCVV